jgi:hypothetical protein
LTEAIHPLAGSRAIVGPVGPQQFRGNTVVLTDKVSKDGLRVESTFDLTGIPENEITSGHYLLFSREGRLIAKARARGSENFGHGTANICAQLRRAGFEI